MSSQNLPNVEQHPLFYVGVYAAITMTYAVAQCISGATLFTGALRASRILFRYGSFLRIPNGLFSHR